MKMRFLLILIPSASLRLQFPQPFCPGPMAEGSPVEEYDQNPGPVFPDMWVHIFILQMIKHLDTHLTYILEGNMFLFQYLFVCD